MVSKSPGKECEEILARICHYKVVSQWVRNRKAKLGGMGVGPQTWGPRPEGRCDTRSAGRHEVGRGSQVGHGGLEREVGSRWQGTNQVESSQPEGVSEPRCSRFVISQLWS